MKLSIGIKSLYSFCAYRSGYIGRKIRQRSEDNFLVLMYHRVLPKDLLSEDIEDGMYVTTDTFECHVQFLIKYFKILPVSELNSPEFRSENQKSKRPVCFVTFDDGWYDFYQYAYPILQKYNIPATIFLTTGYIGTNNWFWTDRIASLLNQVNSIEKKPIDEINDDSIQVISKIEDIANQSHGRLSATIRLLKNYKLNKIEHIIERLSQRWNVHLNLVGRSFLNWGEITEMSHSGLVEFGSHTNNHNILITLSEEEAYNDINISQQLLLEKSLVNKNFQTICYPNGSFNQTIIQTVKRLGFNIAFTTKHDWENYNYNPYEIHRVAIHNDITFNTSLFACRLAGFL